MWLVSTTLARARREGVTDIGSSRSSRPTAGPRSVRVQAVDRAIDVLRALAVASPERAVVAALAQDCGLNRATTWRLLKTLEAQGMAACDASTGRWSIGLTVVELGAAVGPDAMIDAAQPVLERASAASGETADLAMPSAGGLTCVTEVVPSRVLSVSWAGRQVSLHATSTGKAYLAFIPLLEARALLAGPLKAFTATTIADRGALEEELQRIRERGYATCRGEFETTLYGVAAPVVDLRGRTVAVASIWGPLGRVDETRFDELGPLAVEAATAISALRRSAWQAAEPAAGA